MIPEASNHIEEEVVSWLKVWEEIKILVSEETFKTFKQCKKENGILYAWIYMDGPYGKWIKIN